MKCDNVIFQSGVQIRLAPSVSSPFSICVEVLALLPRNTNARTHKGTGRQALKKSTGETGTKTANHKTIDRQTDRHAKITSHRLTGQRATKVMKRTHMHVCLTLPHRRTDRQTDRQTDSQSIVELCTCAWQRLDDIQDQDCECLCRLFSGGVWQFSKLSDSRSKNRLAPES